MTHNITFRYAPIPTETGPTPYGWVGECSCRQYTGQAHNYEDIMAMSEMHLIEVALREG